MACQGSKWYFDYLKFSKSFIPGVGELVLKSDVNQANAKEEYEIMRQLDHKNIVKAGIQTLAKIECDSEANAVTFSAKRIIGV